MTHVNMCEFRGNQRIFTGYIVRTDGQTDGHTDRQTDKPMKSLTLFNFSWKALKTSERNFLRKLYIAMNIRAICYIYNAS